MMLHGKNVLAVSSTVETITVNPVNISKEDKEKVARALSDIFETDYEKTLKKVLTFILEFSILNESKETGA